MTRTRVLRNLVVMFAFRGRLMNNDEVPNTEALLREMRTPDELTV